MNPQILLMGEGALHSIVRDFMGLSFRVPTQTKSADGKSGDAAANALHIQSGPLGRPLLGLAAHLLLHPKYISSYN